MRVFDRVWCGRLSGVISASLISVGVIINKLRGKLTTCLFLANIESHGRAIRVLGGLTYRSPRNISLGNKIIIGKRVTFSTELYESGGLLEIDDSVSIGNNCNIDFTGGVVIEKYAHLAHEVFVITHNHGYNYLDMPKGKSLTIGEHAFIGSRANVLYNCNKIGKYAIVGMGSVVTKDVPDYAIVAGNPAKIIGYTSGQK